MTTTFTLPGNIIIHYSALILGLGALVGLWWTVSKTPDEARYGHLNTALITLAGAILGGRLLYILLHWPYFRSQLTEIAFINYGGLTPSGAAGGALLALWLWSRHKHTSFRSLADAILPLAAALTVSGWLGCWIAGCAYGLEWNAWWALPAPDESNWISPRVPVQLIAVLFTIVWTWALAKPLAGRFVPGQAASLFLAGVSGVHFALTYLRADPIPVGFGLRWDAWSSLVFTAAGLTFYRYVGAQNE